MTPSDNPAAQIGISPAASGPAGALFEGQVGAHYLLTMIAEADPRGLPGMLIERVELQRASEGYPLDDVIIHGITRAGESVVLEVQVKRTITFSPSDPVFKSVAEQLALALQKLDLTQQRHQFAVATERTSFKITGPYQDVLRWAREVNLASVFFGRINRKGVGNDDMRTFVETVRTHLRGVGCASDDETIWQVLRRFHILTFDYDAPGSQSLELAFERARNLLDPADAKRASALWKVLTETAIRVAASGGDLNRNELLDEIRSIDNFQLLGSRRNQRPRETLAEVALLAVADLRRSIAGVSLARTGPLEAVREARDHSRYIEIRGGPGVGKSGLLGMLVDQVLTEGRAIVLTPERTISGGWLAFKAGLQIECSPDAFLADLASDGGAVLFIDSLDFFDDPGKRATVSDLVRAAAAVPAFQVIVTARTNFDTDELNWLPAEALAKLGRILPVALDELAVEEIEELKAAAPTLRALLTDDHPARAVARNLFRLSRLLEIEGPTDQLRTEIDLLERWWTTADGPSANRRNRARVLVDLTDAILVGEDRLAARIESSAVDALIASGSLRELGFDQLMFRHDVLREWGVAARLNESPDKIIQLPLTRAVPPSLVRGIELGARFALERSEDGQVWNEYLDSVSRDGAHASWRRWSLLAILRSELAFSLLDRASMLLLKNDGALLRELIRTTLAVDSRPLAETLAENGASIKSIPASIYGPTNNSWATLSYWLLSKRAQLPLRVLPDVVELFQSLSVSMFTMDSITPLMADSLAGWLEEIENAQDHDSRTVGEPRFVGAFRHRDLQTLATDVRQAFLLMAARVPEVAQSYLRRLLGRRNPDYTIQEIMKFRGSLALSAPAELVDVTLSGLIPKKSQSPKRVKRSEVFTHLDDSFLPSSPAQGPFLDLLNAAPEQGLRLIRHLVDHAITARTGGRAPGDDGFALLLPNGPRFFPWKLSYLWSRDADGFYAVESGLLALEAWAHIRIERGDAPEQVIADILGPESSPAAFLLVAADLLISHWPKTMAAAIPFLGSPELLSFDRNRQVRDALPQMDLIGWGAIGPKEPAGPISLVDLKKRSSRRCGLEHLLGAFALDESTDRDALHALLTDASMRLGPPGPEDTFVDPSFMACHALNVITPANWQPVEGGHTYVSPPEEEQHIQAIQKARAAQTTDFGIDAAIQNALEDNSRSSPELAEQAVAYAQRLSAEPDTSEDALRSRANALVSAALILVRDSTDVFLGQNEDWARNVFAQTFASTDNSIVSQIRDGIRFNPVSIAALGLIHLWRRRGRPDDRDALLELAGRSDPLAAQGFGVGVGIIHEIDRRLVPALVRCALVAQTQPEYEWDDHENFKAANQARHRELVVAATKAEIAWLNDIGPEPMWPTLPPRAISIRRHIKVGPNDTDIQPTKNARSGNRLRSQSAALWLRQLAGRSDSADPSWADSCVDAYADWTAATNGAGLEPGVEINNRADEWNCIFYSLLASALTRMSPDKAAAHVMQAITVPDESFFNIASELLPAIDRVFFNGLGMTLDMALMLRTLLANRLIQTDGWQREYDKSELSVEREIGPAIAALFFNNHDYISNNSCYLLAKGIDLVNPFFPELERLVKEGPVPFSGFLTMNILEVSPRPSQLPFLLSSALNWLQRQPTNTSLWIDYGLGARVAMWLGAVLGMDNALLSTSYLLRPEIDDVLARLVRVGVAKAHRLEVMLSAV